METNGKQLKKVRVGFTDKNDWVHYSAGRNQGNRPKDAERCRVKTTVLTLVISHPIHHLPLMHQTKVKN